MEAAQTRAPEWHPNPPRATQVICAARSDVGRVRNSNEDSLDFDAETGLLVLADGMGGCNGGEIASAMAVNIVSSEFRQLALTLPHEESNTPGLSQGAVRLCTAIAKANREIFQLGLLQSHLSVMGTTLVTALFSGFCVTISSIGYLLVFLLLQGHFE